MDDYGEQWHRWNLNIEKVLHRIQSDQQIPAENKELINNFVTYLTARGSKSATIWRHVYCYGKLLRAFGPNVKILEATREEIVRAMANVEKLDLGHETKVKIKITLKFLYKHYKGEDLYYPREVAWIKTTRKRESQIAPSDLLTEEEINKMIENATNPRDVAIISLLADAPIRSHELLLLRRKHLMIGASEAYVIIPEGTKTGTRRIPLVNSVPHLVQYLNVFQKIRPEDPLFLHELWNGERKGIRYDALRTMLRKVAAKAGIKKRIYPYLFRHTVITKYANRLSNAQLEKVAGWTHGTEMHNTYEHLSDLDVSKAVAKANGIETSEEVEEIKPRIKICGRCSYTNSKDAMYCGRCGSALSLEVALQEEKESNALDEALARYLDDPKHFEEALHRVLMGDYRKRRK